MLLSTNTITLSQKFGDKKAIELLAEAGFTALDYSVTELVLFSENPAKYAEDLRRFADSKGVKFTQSHAPLCYAATLEDFIKIRKEQTAVGIETASILGAEYIAVHPLQFGKYKGNEQMHYDMNMEYFSYLLPLAEKSNVKIACENVFLTEGDKIIDGVCSSPEEFIRYIDDMNSPYFVACLDFGHAEITGRRTEDIIMKLRNRIKALHIHDNNREYDQHKLPGTGSFNWQEIIKALKEVGYNGNFNLEPDGYVESLDDTLIPAGLKDMYTTAAEFMNKLIK